MTPEELEKLATVRPTNYFGDLYDYLDDGFGRVLGMSRDSDYIERSNWDYVIKHLSDRFPNEDWVINRASHFLVGWVDELLVKIHNEDDSYTNLFLWMVDLHTRLENYPILDEFKASQYEWDENHPEHDDLCYSDDFDCSCGRKRA